MTFIPTTNNTNTPSKAKVPLDYIEDLFGPRGRLAQHLPAYVPRPSQIDYARAVDQAIARGIHLVVEGPTGTGKSVAYTGPAVRWAIGQGLRIVIVTKNIALQEQLHYKDLPALAKILPWPFTHALVKGRNNYLCVDALKGLQFKYSKERADLTRMANEIKEWAKTTKTGDKSELPFEPPDEVWRRFSVVAEDCKKSDCAHAHECFSERARQLAENANVVVTNYHMFFAHLIVREKTTKCIVLPHFDVAILDEAHEAADIARDFMGFNFGGGGITWLAKQLQDDSELSDQLAADGERFFEGLYRYYDSPLYKSRLRSPSPVPWKDLYETLQDAATAFEKELDTADPEDADELARIRNLVIRAKTYAAQISAAMQLAHPEFVYYLEPARTGNKVRLRSKQISVSGRLRKLLFDSSTSGVRSVIVTSATLESAGSFDHVVNELGIGRCNTLRVNSPFKWNEQAVIVIPRGMPLPGSPDYTDAVADNIRKVVLLAKGRTLCLFTSYKNLHAAYDALQGVPYNILKQTERSRTALVEEFKRDVHSVLLGTDSFWQGIDVPGMALSCVVIDRLPFPSPDDPVLDALSENDRDTFSSYSIPRAVIAFKQGVGRLIRTVKDRGVVVILDRRILEKGYGKKYFIPSLPEGLGASEDIEDVALFLNEAS